MRQVPQISCPSLTRPHYAKFSSIPLLKDRREAPGIKPEVHALDISGPILNADIPGDLGTMDFSGDLQKQIRTFSPGPDPFQNHGDQICTSTIGNHVGKDHTKDVN